ncbi:hypothetical protein GCM10027262_22990 [Nocardia tengchongensis]
MSGDNTGSDRHKYPAVTVSDTDPNDEQLYPGIAHCALHRPAVPLRGGHRPAERHTSPAAR